MRPILIFGIITTLSFNPISISAKDVYIGGDSLGIEAKYEGVMVSGTYDFIVNDTKYNPKSVLNSGDQILSVNNQSVQTIQELYDAILTYKDSINNIPITILRDNEQIQSFLQSVYDPNTKTYKSGIYVKDKIVGVGTLTYIDPENNAYGALGHDIYDNDTKEIADVNQGRIFPATIVGIKKANEHLPGEKQASIDYSNPIGNLNKNTPVGVYGNISSLMKKHELIQTATQDEITKGEATIYTVVDQNKINEYIINITAINKQRTSAVKGIEYDVIDQELIDQTSGIIQGMSGSPIVQNGKLIGAVTHVNTNNPLKGYGVYIDWMLSESNNLPKTVR